MHTQDEVKPNASRPQTPEGLGWTAVTQLLRQRRLSAQMGEFPFPQTGKDGERWREGTIYLFLTPFLYVKAIDADRSFKALCCCDSRT